MTASTPQAEASPNCDKPLVSVVVVTYNRCCELQRALQSVRKLDYPNVEIIVWDNNSSDNTVDMIKAEFPDVQLFRSKTNLGPAVGRNRAVAATEGKYVFHLDDDAWLTADCISILLRLAEQCPDLAVVSAQVIEMRNQTEARDPSPQSRAIRFQSAFPGGASLYRRTSFDQVGGFHENLFRMAEESDLALRLLECGQYCAAANAATVYHLPSANIRNRKNDMLLNLRNTTDTAFRLFPFPYNWLKLARNVLYVWQYAWSYRSLRFLIQALNAQLLAVARSRSKRRLIRLDTYHMHRRLLKHGRKRQNEPNRLSDLEDRHEK